jgi:hypothetical protein
MGILSSPRWRRRLTYLVVPLALAPLVYLGVHYSTPGDPGDATGPEVAGTVEPKSSPFTPAEQRAVRPVLKEFISAAVARKGVARAWDVAGPTLRQGLTRKEWNRGDIPVVPYPAGTKGLGTWSAVQYSYPKTVGLEVVVFPKPGSGVAATTADVELVKGPDGRWRVDYWLARPFRGGPGLTAKEARKREKEVAKEAAKTRERLRLTERDVDDRPKASKVWWAIPIGLLSLIVLIPLTIGLVFWYQNRKAMRAYERTSGA